MPHGIVGSRDGLIYLSDRANNRIQVFRQNGEFVREKILRPRCGAQEKATWTPKRPCGNEATFSVGFSPDAAQTYIYSADGGSHVITVLRRSDLEVVSEFGGSGVGARSARTPAQPDGRSVRQHLRRRSRRPRSEAPDDGRDRPGRLPRAEICLVQYVTDVTRSHGVQNASRLAALRLELRYPCLRGTRDQYPIA